MASKKSIKVDFLVSSNLYNIKISDLSEWGITANKTAIIEITPPGYTEPIFIEEFHKEDTLYDSICLGFACGEDCEDQVELPDGVWEITIKASPSSFNKTVHYIKLDKYQRALDDNFIKNIDEDCKGCRKEQLLDLLFYKHEMEALIRSGDKKRAQYRYGKAIKEMKSLLNCKNC